MTTPSSFASAPSSSLDGPGIASASSKLAWSSAWQKYCEANSSGRQTIRAPCAGGVADFLDGAGAVFLRVRAAAHLHEREPGLAGGRG